MQMGTVSPQSIDFWSSSYARSIKGKSIRLFFVWNVRKIIVRFVWAIIVSFYYVVFI